MLKNHATFVGGLALGALLLSGCGSSKEAEQVTRLQRDLELKNQEIAKLEAARKEKEAALANSQAELERKAKELAEAKRLGEMTSKETKTTTETPGEMFAGAKPGECFAKVFKAPVYRTETERIVKREASEKVIPVPARYEWTTERVLVKEASKKLVTIPAVYEYVTETVEVEPARTKTVTIPAKYETVTERVEVTPAHTVWKRGQGPAAKYTATRIDDKTGEILCLVEVPATYKTVKKTVLKEPATTKEIEIPAVTKTIRKRVVKEPATTREVEIPAEYATVRVRKEVSPADVKRIPIEAEYQTITKQVLVSEAQHDWQRVLCQTNTTPNVISEVQRELRKQGFHPGPIDGQLGVNTLAAINAYQRAKNLYIGALTLETLESLGIKW
jgi:outer membrane murein-binding lipoprotein Lpp